MGDGVSVAVVEARAIDCPKTWAAIVCASCYRRIGEGPTSLTVSADFSPLAVCVLYCTRAGCKSPNYLIPARTR